MNVGRWSLVLLCQKFWMKYLTRNLCNKQCLSLTAGGRSHSHMCISALGNWPKCTVASNQPRFWGSALALIFWCLVLSRWSLQFRPISQEGQLDVLYMWDALATVWQLRSFSWLPLWDHFYSREQHLGNGHCVGRNCDVKCCCWMFSLSNITKQLFKPLHTHCKQTHAFIKIQMLNTNTFSSNRKGCSEPVFNSILITEKLTVQLWSTCYVANGWSWWIPFIVMDYKSLSKTMIFFGSSANFLHKNVLFWMTIVSLLTS